VLGLRAALGIPAVTYNNLETMAAARPKGDRVLAVADALRGEWLVQLFTAGAPPLPLGEAGLARPEVMPDDPTVRVVGFDLGKLATSTGWRGALELDESPALAPIALTLAAVTPSWDDTGLTHPVYLRPPVPVPG